MHKLFIFISLLFFVHVGFLFAQVVNIENKRINDGSYGLSGAVDMTFSTIQQDNLLLTLMFKPLIQYKFGGKKALETTTQIESANGDLSASALTRPDKNKHLLLLINDLKYSASKEETYANFGMSHLRYAYRIEESIWKWESYVQIQYNEKLLERVRTLVGSGFRGKLIDQVKTKKDGQQAEFRLFLGTSLFQEYEEINRVDAPIEYVKSLRWNTYISTYFHFKTIELTSSTYFQPNLSQSLSDHRILGDYSFLLQISDPFRIKINVSYFYDSRPAPTVGRTILSTSFGFVYQLNSTKK